jgi:anti-sigma regulatory factor (Ser/Thr protein kinase)
VNDSIRLTIPHARPYVGVARLVVGGLAARLELPYEALEDVQLALDGVLANEAYAAAGTITIEVELEGTALAVVVGPLKPGRLEADLAAASDEVEGVGLGRLLETVMAGHDVERRDGGDFLRMRKDLPARAARGAS